MRRSVVFKIAIAVGSFAIALAAAEGIARSVLVARTGATDFATLRDRYLGKDLPIFRRDEAGELELKASAAMDGRTINRQGFRGRDLLEPKPADGFRVACIGGSGCFGTTSTGDARTFPAFLEARLREGASVPEHVEVINAGLPGATTAMAVARFEKHVAPQKPDAVVLYNLINDLLTSRRAKLGLDERTLPLVTVDGPISSALSHSALYLAWRASETNAEKKARGDAAIEREKNDAARREERGVEARRVQSAKSRESGYAYDGTPASNLYLVKPHVDEFRRTLARFASSAKAANARAVYCTFPMRFTGQEQQYDYERDGPATAYWMPDWRMMSDAMATMNEMIREAAHETGSVLCDLDRELPRRREYFAPRDTDHLTDEGCREVAALLADALARDGVLRAAAAPR